MCACAGWGSFSDEKRKELGEGWAGAVRWCSKLQLIVRVCGVGKQCSRRLFCERRVCSGARACCVLEWGENTANYRIRQCVAISRRYYETIQSRALHWLAANVVITRLLNRCVTLFGGMVMVTMDAGDTGLGRCGNEHMWIF